MKRFNCDEVFNKYIENEKLEMANIFHLYDTGEKCIENNTGFHDSRHFNLIAYNTHIMQKKQLGLHDEINSFNPADVQFHSIRIYNDGSTMLKFNHLVKFHNFHALSIE